MDPVHKCVFRHKSSQASKTDDRRLCADRTGRLEMPIHSQQVTGGLRTVCMTTWRTYDDFFVTLCRSIDCEVSSVRSQFYPLRLSLILTDSDWIPSLMVYDGLGLIPRLLSFPPLLIIFSSNLIYLLSANIGWRGWITTGSKYITH